MSCYQIRPPLSLVLSACCFCFPSCLISVSTPGANATRQQLHCLPLHLTHQRTSAFPDKSRWFLESPFIWLFPGRGPPRWQSRCVRRLRLGSVMWTCKFHYHTLRKRYLESSLLNHLYVLGLALLFHVSLCLSQHHTSLSLSYRSLSHKHRAGPELLGLTFGSVPGQ